MSSNSEKREELKKELMSEALSVLSATIAERAFYLGEIEARELCELPDLNNIPVDNLADAAIEARQIVNSKAKRYIRLITRDLIQKCVDDNRERWKH